MLNKVLDRDLYAKVQVYLNEAAALDRTLQEYIQRFGHPRKTLMNEFYDLHNPFINMTPSWQKHESGIFIRGYKSQDNLTIHLRNGIHRAEGLVFAKKLRPKIE